MTTILGLDLGKLKSGSCLYRPATQETAYATIGTDPTLLRRHLEHLRPDLVVFETCTVAGWVADLCDELRLPHCIAVETAGSPRRSVANQSKARVLALWGRCGAGPSKRAVRGRTGLESFAVRAEVTRPAFPSAGA